jgi:hypothetical protein
MATRQIKRAKRAIRTHLAASLQISVSVRQRVFDASRYPRVDVDRLQAKGSFETFSRQVGLRMIGEFDAPGNWMGCDGTSPGAET